MTRDLWLARGRTKEAPPKRGWLILYGVLGGILVTFVVVSLTTIPPQDFGVDYRYYRDLGLRWLADGSYYLPRQLAGPYDVRLMADVLYPPNALLLFVPFAVLPAVLWWAVPVGVMLYVIRGMRPAPWAIASMLVLLLWPRAYASFIFGNTDMWMMAGVAAGLRWGWPAVLMVLKPTFAVFALVGLVRPTRRIDPTRRGDPFVMGGRVDTRLALNPLTLRRRPVDTVRGEQLALPRPMERVWRGALRIDGGEGFHALTLRRSWLAALVLLALVSLPMLPLWFDYAVSVRNLRIDPWYSLGSVPLLMVPVVGWLGQAESV